MILRVKTTLKAMLNKLPAPVVAKMIEVGWLDGWPLELTRKGKREIRVVFLQR